VDRDWVARGKTLLKALVETPFLVSTRFSDRGIGRIDGDERLGNGADVARVRRGVFPWRLWMGALSAEQGKP
jgi:hypothetical protein